ncbi:hypothetical protein TRFO_31089 [Tritrichomonas foetus]|uniref:protein disulfide-isomerase n=1 Tax=Tritrichomonas foetus TaxID=1144522 RepID=A0A1J4JS65_9EUKA|nr:hypothetical protein TRFO_31089 [Tritrichomonas foetus]|eukprot:OHT01953.1 hypothetical protein TRFO_31089 [Tritrichomonas foetus]
MFLLFVLSFFRVPQELGHIYYTNKYDETNVTDFLKDNKPCVLIFAQNNISSFEYTNLALKRFAKHIKFAVGTDSAAKVLNIPKIPSIHLFVNGAPTSNFTGFSNSIAFSRWCQEIHQNATNSHIVYEYEDLRLILESRATVLLGVNSLKPPKEYKNDIRFIAVQSHAFSFFNISVQTGYYIYRGIDRQLIRTSGNYNSYAKTPLVDVEKDDIKRKQYFCGFFMDILNSSVASQEITLLQNLARKFPDFYFGPISGSVSRFMSTFGQLEYIKKPFLVVWNTSDISKNRWTLLGDEAHDVTTVESFLNDIKDGKREFNHISQTLNESLPENAYTLVHSNFFKKIEEEKRCSLVLFYKTKTGFEYRFHNIINHSREILPEIAFFTFDISKNDFPEGVPHTKSTPFMVLFKKNEEPSMIGVGSSLQNFVSELVNAAGNGIKMPDIDYAELQDKMGQEMQEEINRENK